MVPADQSKMKMTPEWPVFRLNKTRRGETEEVREGGRTFLWVLSEGR